MAKSPDSTAANSSAVSGWTGLKAATRVPPAQTQGQVLEFFGDTLVEMLEHLRGDRQDGDLLFLEGAQDRFRLQSINVSHRGPGKKGQNNRSHEGKGVKQGQQS